MFLGAHTHIQTIIVTFKTQIFGGKRPKIIVSRRKRPTFGISHTNICTAVRVITPDTTELS